MAAKDDLNEPYAGYDEKDEPHSLVESKFGYTKCSECGLQSVKGTNSTHPWCVQIAKLKRRVDDLENAIPARFVVTCDGVWIGNRSDLKAAVALGRTAGHFVVLDSRDDAKGGIAAPWRAASCDGKTLIVNHPGGGQTISPADAAEGTD